MAKATILFADNDSDFLRTRAEFLEHEGYLVVPANNPTEARRKLELGGVDLAIVDIRLENDDDDKDTSGLVLAKEIAHSVPKIILTGFPSYEYARESLKRDADGLAAAVGFLDKREGPEALLSAVGKALEVGTSASRQVRRVVDQKTPIILLADNDADFLETLKALFEAEGYRVVTAANPSEARKILERGGIDLAFIDIRLQDDAKEDDISGLTLAKETAFSIPKIILTAFPSNEYVREVLKPAFDGLPVTVDFVAKQEGVEAMLAVARRQLAQSAEREEKEVQRKRESKPQTIRIIRQWVRLVATLASFVGLFAALGTGVYAIFSRDPQGLIATIVLVAFWIAGVGIAVFMPE